MNQDSSDSSGKSEIEDVVDTACRDFERRFRGNPAFRIENLLDEVSRLVSTLATDAQRGAAKREIVAELIFVEMELRQVAGQTLVTQEYRDRFPEFESVIYEALNRVRKLHAEFRESCSVVTVTIDSGATAEELTGQVQIDPVRETNVPRKLGPYREISEINSGGFGIVCRAIDSRNGGVVALKFPRKDKLKDDSDLQLFLDEANKAMMLDHPGIVRTHSIERSDGYLAIVQQFVDGSDLKAIRHRTRTHKEIARLVESIAKALAFAHQNGIYHRDLKPGNILIDQQGRPYVADFGLALNETEQIFLPKQTCGTAHYMPPEQVAGLTRLLDGRSDIWSLGVILYELLTKRRPFEGLNTVDVFEQIENKDPRPPRQIDPSIPKELQRICLKCLERQQRDRYPTADDLADDLRHWAERADTPAHGTDSLRQMIPKGLRSYSAEDAAFFLELLPGPRDREGLPGSILFWKTRIVEPVAPESRVPVGVIIGPSGSGKSSFVKAGLLPQLGREVLTLYVEATQADTEVRLLKALRQRLVDVPEEISLPELFRGLGFGNWLPAPYTKLLIVIDQFEQRLSQADDPGTSQIARALRYCDGEHIQCLLLTRDDFMMALARFIDALEMDLREGENSQAIDLFDLKHARKVLARLGRAYERLPAEPAVLSEDEESFLDEAVQQLAEDNHVICVRLALFAEMFRHRPWTPTELKLVGGVAGTGEKFLEATFGPGGRDKRHRLQREFAQRVLEALLPAAGTNIRGAMKPEQELVAAAKLQNQSGQFGELVKTLDAELKLITRTDPDHPQDSHQEKPETPNPNGWYQLTHDYLVPSVRSWLDRNLGKTRSGRAQLRLRDIAAQIVPGQPPRILPTNTEWLAWQFQIPRNSLGENERLLMRAAGKRFVRQASLALAILLVLGAIAGYLTRVTRVNGLIRDLIHLDVSSVPEIAAKLKEHQFLAEPRLRSRFADSQTNSDDRIRVAMGLFPFDSGVSRELINAIIDPKCQPKDLECIAGILERNGYQEFTQLSQVLADSASPPRSRFRALCADVLLHHGESDWSQFAGLVASSLWDEPQASIEKWIGILQMAGDSFSPTVSDIFEPLNDANQATTLAAALYHFHPEDTRNSKLAELVPQANAIRFNAILSVIEENKAEASFAETLQETLNGVKTEFELVNVAIALFRLGQYQYLTKLFSGEFDSLETALAINLAGTSRTKLQSIREYYEHQEIKEAENVNLRRSVLQVLALKSSDVFDRGLANWLLAVAQNHVTFDVDACCFSTSELIIRQIEPESIRHYRQERKRNNSGKKRLGNVYINSIDQAFGIFQLEEQDGSGLELAISTTEISNQEIKEYEEAVGKISRRDYSDLNYPFELQNLDFLIVCEYCNWVCVQDGLSDQCCYGANLTIQESAKNPADASTFGYRIPTVSEWTNANKSNRVVEQLAIGGFLEQENHELAENYAWLLGNSRGKPREVAMKLPNALGLFDTFGNLHEICEVSRIGGLAFVAKGFSATSRPQQMKLDVGRPAPVTQPVKQLEGVRLFRRLD